MFVNHLSSTGLGCVNSTRLFFQAAAADSISAANPFTADLLRHPGAFRTA